VCLELSDRNHLTRDFPSNSKPRPGTAFYFIKSWNIFVDTDISMFRRVIWDPWWKFVKASWTGLRKICHQSPRKSEPCYLKVIHADYNETVVVSFWFKLWIPSSRILSSTKQSSSITIWQTLLVLLGLSISSFPSSFKIFQIGQDYVMNANIPV